MSSWLDEKTPAMLVSKAATAVLWSAANPWLLLSRTSVRCSGSCGDELAVRPSGGFLQAATRLFSPGHFTSSTGSHHAAMVSLCTVRGRSVGLSSRRCTVSCLESTRVRATSKLLRLHHPTSLFARGIHELGRHHNLRSGWYDMVRMGLEKSLKT